MKFYLLVCFVGFSFCSEGVRLKQPPKGFLSMSFLINSQNLLWEGEFGFSQRLSLGMPLFIQRAIGTGSIKMNFPPIVSIKYIFYDKRGIIVRGGYFDPFGYETHPEKEMSKLCGIFLSLSKLLLHKREFWISAGGFFRPNDRLSSGFLNLTFYPSDYLGIAAEGIIKEKQKAYINLGLEYLIFPPLKVGLFIKNAQGEAERFLSFYYCGRIF